MNRTKKAISEVFWQLLEEKPYNKITVQNIVERCQVNRNTFYYHFQDIPALVEYSIKEWTERIIRENSKFGSAINCLVSITKELVKRKTAFNHIYHSVCDETLIRYMNETSHHIVQSYIENATKSTDLPSEGKVVLIRYYKSILVGVVLDWFAAGTSYDLIDFCQTICQSYEGSCKNAVHKLATTTACL